MKRHDTASNAAGTARALVSKAIDLLHEAKGSHDEWHDLKRGQDGIDDEDDCEWCIEYDAACEKLHGLP